MAGASLSFSLESDRFERDELPGVVGFMRNKAAQCGHPARWSRRGPNMQVGVWRCSGERLRFPCFAAREGQGGFGLGGSKEPGALLAGEALDLQAANFGGGEHGGSLERLLYGGAQPLARLLEGGIVSRRREAQVNHNTPCQKLRAESTCDLSVGHLKLSQ
jgi:hypothetical protein